MPVLIQWILDVMPKMGNVLMLCGFVFLVFGIVGACRGRGESGMSAWSVYGQVELIKGGGCLRAIGVDHCSEGISLWLGYGYQSMVARCWHCWLCGGLT